MLPILHVALPSYTLCICLGIAAGFLVTRQRAGLYGLRRRQFAAGFAAAVLGAALGGRLFFLVQRLPDYLQSGNLTPSGFISFILHGGQVFYGGMLGAFLFIWLAAHLQGASGWSLLDALLPALPLAQAFGRIGCLMAGCCYGLPGIGFYLPALGETVFPIQLAESICTFAIYVVLADMSQRPLPSGRLLGSYLTLYGLTRFILEFFRGDAIRGFIGPLSVAQWISLLCIAAGVLLLRWARQKTAPENGTAVPGSKARAI